MGYLKSACVYFLVFALLSACEKRDKYGHFKESTTNGQISISADESLRPIVEAELDAFMSKYKFAKIHVEYGSEAFAIDKALNDTFRLAILSRPFTDNERAVLKQKKLIGKSIKIGYDAIAVIVNKDNPDSLFTYEQLQGLFRGELTTWKQINPESTLKDIKIIFDDANAASVRYMKDSVARVDKLPSNCYAVNANPKVIEYVSKDKGAIGLIGVGWISDKDDTVTRGFLDVVTVASLSKPGQSGPDDFYQPYQAYIAQGEYPLIREIYILNKEAGIRLGSGFTSYVASDKGQRIILKSGLVPATMPVRLIKINKDPINFE
jgi:phosphate transport system substrate-binding protein